MIKLNKCWGKLQEIGFNSYQNRKLKLISENILTKIRMLKDDTDEDGNVIKTMKAKLSEYHEKNGKDFPADISTSTLEAIAKLCQCQPSELYEWVDIELDPEESYAYKVEHQVESAPRRLNKK